jgi:hypothetical protein
MQPTDWCIYDRRAVGKIRELASTLPICGDTLATGIDGVSFLSTESIVTAPVGATSCRKFMRPDHAAFVPFHFKFAAPLKRADCGTAAVFEIDGVVASVTTGW